MMDLNILHSQQLFELSIIYEREFIMTLNRQD